MGARGYFVYKTDRKYCSFFFLLCFSFVCVLDIALVFDLWFMVGEAVFQANFGYFKLSFTYCVQIVATEEINIY